jgi:hypothetical protein
VQSCGQNQKSFVIDKWYKQPHEISKNREIIPKKTARLQGRKTARQNFIVQRLQLSDKNSVVKVFFVISKNFVFLKPLQKITSSSKIFSIEK